VTNPDPSTPERRAQYIARGILRPVVGDFVAKTAVRMAAKKLGKEAESIEVSDFPALAEALRGALRGLIGTPSADALVKQLEDYKPTEE
jgi:hypothetical protein